MNPSGPNGIPFPVTATHGFGGAMAAAQSPPSMNVCPVIAGRLLPIVIVLGWVLPPSKTEDAKLIESVPVCPFASWIAARNVQSPPPVVTSQTLLPAVASPPSAVELTMNPVARAAFGIAPSNNAAPQRHPSRSLVRPRPLVVRQTSTVTPQRYAAALIKRSPGGLRPPVLRRQARRLALDRLEQLVPGLDERFRPVLVELHRQLAGVDPLVAVGLHDLLAVAAVLRHRVPDRAVVG